MSKNVESQVELVVTASEPTGTYLSYQTRSRTTIGVLNQIITEAERYVIIAAPFIQPGLGLSPGTLTVAVQKALERGVDIDVLSTEKSLRAIDRTFLTQGTTGQLRYYLPAAHIKDDRQLGSHAKFCVADGRIAYVGSANLTGPGLVSQIEMGVLIRGPIAYQVKQFWDYAVELGLFILI